MAINYVEKYDLQKLVDEKFVERSKTEQLVNQDYDFVGAKTVKVYNIGTVPLTDYKRTGVNRFGSPDELNTNVQEMTMTQDQGFTFTIDKMNEDESLGALNAGKALNRQIRERVIPEVDKYRLTEMVSNAGKSAAVNLTATNIYDKITEATEYLDDAEVPFEGRKLVVTPATHTLMKKNKDIVMETDIGQEMRARGVVALVDGMEVVKIPSNRLPENFGFMVCHNVATTAPVKLAEYRIHEDAPGISGSLVEGRVYFDAFVLDNKKDAIFVHNNSTGA